jgi:hypothetical protein
MSTKIDLVSGLESAVSAAAKAQVRVDKLTEKIEKLEAQRAEIVNRFATATVGTKRPGRPAGSKNVAKADGETKRGRAPNG